VTEALPRLAAVVAILAVVALYILFTAQRLDRLHRRVDMAAAGLDAQLQRRAVATANITVQVPLPPDLALALAAAAAGAAATTGLGHDREAVENALSRQLDDLAGFAPEVFGSGAPVTVELHEELVRVLIARTFYNDTVRDALVVRERRLVRWLRLAGSAPHPSYFEMAGGALAATRVPVAVAP
jgi:hypothetical protein